jgi:hypothetical protein
MLVSSLTIAVSHADPVRLSCSLST